jgi:hypothetical protein
MINFGGCAISWGHGPPKMTKPKMLTKVLTLSIMSIFEEV